MHLIYRNLILIFIHYTKLFIYIGNEQKGLKVKEKVALLLENISFPFFKDSSYLCDISYYNDAYLCTFLLGTAEEEGVQLTPPKLLPHPPKKKRERKRKISKHNFGAIAAGKS